MFSPSVISEVLIPLIIVGLGFLAIFILAYLTSYFLKINKLKKIMGICIIVTALFCVGAYIVILQQDWSIDECYDSQGNFLADDDKCQFP